MGVIGGRVVKTPKADQPYKVVLEYEGGSAETEHPVSSVREGEVLIRQRSPSLPRTGSMREDPLH